MNLLLVEDDRSIGKSLKQAFQEAGVECVWAIDGESGLEQALSQQFDIIVMDVLLPRRNGLDSVEMLRRRGIKTPVIVLTALSEVERRIEGLERGADDYMVKPFSFAELMARIEAICRRTQERSSPVLEMGQLRLDLATRRLTRAGTEIHLSPTEHRLMEFLMRRAGQLVTRKMLCEHVWGEDWEDNSGYVIDVHINRLRGKLDRRFESSLIETVRGRGYVLRASES